jgi:hypothetical protein
MCSLPSASPVAHEVCDDHVLKRLGYRFFLCLNKHAIESCGKVPIHSRFGRGCVLGMGHVMSDMSNRRYSIPVGRTLCLLLTFFT